MIRRPPKSPPFPYPTPSRSAHVPATLHQARENLTGHAAAPFARSALELLATAGGQLQEAMTALAPDRKSTRLNSSHGYISYAVFCLKKKNNNTISTASK